MLDSYLYDPSYYTTGAGATTTTTAANSDQIAEAIAVLLGLGFVFWLVIIALAIFVLVARWKLFKKANVPGWESLIPVHGDIVELQLGGVSTAVWFLNLIAICGIGPLIFAFWKNIALAKAFGKGTGMGILLTLVPVVAYPILAFGSAEYVGPATNSNTQA